MKKMVFITTLIAILMISTIVNALGFAVNITASKEVLNPGDTVSVTFSLADVDVGVPGIMVFKGTLEYDTSMFEPLKSSDMSGLNGWSNPTYNETTGEIAIDKGSYTTNNESIIKIDFKVKSNSTIGIAAIRLKDIQASDGTNLINASNTLKNLTVEQKIIVDDNTNTDNNTSNTDNNTVNNTNTNSTVNVNTNNTTTTTTVNNNTSTNTSSLPKTGVESFSIVGIAILVVIAIVSSVKYKSMNI